MATLIIQIKQKRGHLAQLIIIKQTKKSQISLLFISYAFNFDLLSFVKVRKFLLIISQKFFSFFFQFFY